MFQCFKYMSLAKSFRSVQLLLAQVQSPNIGHRNHRTLCGYTACRSTCLGAISISVGEGWRFEVQGPARSNSNDSETCAKLSAPLDFFTQQWNSKDSEVRFKFSVDLAQVLHKGAHSDRLFRSQELQLLRQLTGHNSGKVFSLGKKGAMSFLHLSGQM